MEQDQIRLKILGDLWPHPPFAAGAHCKTDEISTHYDGFQAKICVNYGGRDEIVHAARQFAQDCVDGKARPGRSDRGKVRRLSLTAGIPDPELIIRPSGEIRTSNFMPWQSAYSEYYFTDVLWPDFDEAELDPCHRGLSEARPPVWRRKK